MTATRLDAELLRAWPLPVDHDGDKSARGSVLVVGGSELTPGAVILAGIAALRMGAGRLQIATAAATAIAVAVAVPEAMVLPIACGPDGCLDAGAPGDHLRTRLAAADVVLLGPGMLGREPTLQVLAELVPLIGGDAQVVLDAAALACWPELGADVRDPLRERLLLTPNSAELEALCAPLDGLDDPPGVDVTDPADARSGPDLVALAARRHGAVVTSFGEVASSRGERWCDGPGHPGLGTSGSGDVLAGLVAGAAARCREPSRAACWATYVHGTAGTRLSERLGELGFLARELLDEAPLVVRSLHG
jgi:hydroxyethylthiazole kinase-like uncharacterized protein yjeF